MLDVAAVRAVRWISHYDQRLGELLDEHDQLVGTIENVEDPREWSEVGPFFTLRPFVGRTFSVLSIDGRRERVVVGPTSKSELRLRVLDGSGATVATLTRQPGWFKGHQVEVGDRVVGFLNLRMFRLTNTDGTTVLERTLGPHVPNQLLFYFTAQVIEEPWFSVALVATARVWASFVEVDTTWGHA